MRRGSAIENVRQRYLITTFAYGCGLGATQSCDGNPKCRGQFTHSAVFDSASSTDRSSKVKRFGEYPAQISTEVG